jgi:hypothetical protein
MHYPSTKTQSKNKRRMTKFLSVIAAVMSIFVLMITASASVSVKSSAPDTAEVTFGGELRYNLYNDIKQWFDYQRQEINEDIIDENIEIVLPIVVDTEPAGSYNYESAMFTFIPAEGDIGKTFDFTFNVEGSLIYGRAERSKASHTVRVTVTNNREATPNISIDYANNQLTGFLPGHYTIAYSDITSAFNYLTDPSMEVQHQWTGKRISIVKSGNFTTLADSLPQYIDIPAIPAAPTLIYSTTLAPDDGRITNLEKNKTYEYNLNNSPTKKTITGVREIKGLAPGDYSVRYPATESSFASASLRVRVNDYSAERLLTPSSLSISPGTLTPTLQNDVVEYTATVPYDVSKVTISADSDRLNNGLGEKSLSVGENTFLVYFWESSMVTHRFYYITVIRQPKPQSAQPNPEPKPTPSSPSNTSSNTPSYSSPSPSPSLSPSTPKYEPGEAQEFTTKSGITSTVTVSEDGVTVEAGLNKSGSLNSEATSAAVKKAAEIAKENGESSVTIDLPVGTTGLSKSTVKKLIEAAGDMAVQVNVPTVFDGEAVGSISVPLTETTGQILTGMTFKTDRTQQFENYVTNKWSTAVLGSFETAQKGGWGGTATLSVSMDKLGFSADDGTKLYAIIYDSKTGKLYQVPAVIDGGNVVFETKRTGIVTIVTANVK